MASEIKRRGALIAASAALLTKQTASYAADDGADHPIGAKVSTRSRLNNATAFEVEFPQAQLDALRQRIESTEWPDTPAAAAWTYGTDVAFMKDLTAYWLDGFDWRVHERKINRFPQYLARVNGRAIHFMYGGDAPG